MIFFKRFFSCLSVISLVVIFLLWVTNQLPVNASSITTEQLDQVNRLWQGSAHAITEVNCSSCHQDTDSKEFIARPTEESCQSCHEYEVQTFHFGKHGIRLAERLSPLTPAMAEIPMKASASKKIMNCNACHDVHSVNTQTAAVDSCLTCHNDNHSLNYKNSKHGKNVIAEGVLPRPSETSVTCATCHLPREHNELGEKILVNHNNTYNLLPRDRMVADVCMHCHGMEYSYNSMFDDALVDANFDRSPNQNLETLKLIRALEKKRLGKS